MYYSFALAGHRGTCLRPLHIFALLCFKEFHSIHILSIAVSYRRCGRNLRAKLGTVINSLSTNHAYLKTLYISVFIFDFNRVTITN